MINSIAINQILILFLQCFVVASLILVFFRLRTIFGLGLFYIAIGLFKFMHYFFTQAFSLEIASGIHILIGPTVITPVILFSLLLIYIREDAGEVRKIIYAMIFFNFFFAVMLRISALGINGAGFTNILNLPEHFFRMGIGSLIAGSLVLFIDGIVLIVLYEFISKKISSIFLRIFLTMTSVLLLHALIFSSVSLIFKPVDTSLLQRYAISLLISKAIPITIYTVIFWLYIIYFERWDANSKLTGSSFRDVFNLLTYRQKYEQVFKEKETQKVELQKSEEYNRMLFVTSPIGLALSEMNGLLVDINPAYAQLLGRTIDETLKLSYGDITPEKYNKQEALQLKSLEETGKYGPYEKEYIHKEGHLVTVLLNGLMLERGGKKYILSSVEDITERKQAEKKLKAYNQQLQATEQQLRAANQQLDANFKQLIATEQTLRESEEKYRLAFINSPDSINITRLSDGKLVEANKSFEKITGHKVSDSLGKKTTDLNLWENLDDREVIKEKLSRGEKIENFEFIRNMKNGYKAFTVMSAAIITIKNEPHLLSVIRDIDDLKNAEIRLRDNEARLKEAELIAQMGNFTWDIKSGDVTWSEGLHILLGYDKSKKIDYNKVNAEIHHPDDLERITAWLNECIASGKSSFPPNEYRLLCKDGKVIHVQTTVKVLFQDDLPHKIIGTVEDITERKLAEEALNKSKNRYQSLFNNSPVPLWEEDFSEVKKFIDLLKQDNVRDFKAYFKNHPDKVLTCSQMIKITDVNYAVLKLHEAKSKEDLLEGLPSIFTDKSYEAFTQELIAIAEGKSIQEFEGNVKTLKKKEKDVYIKWMIVPGYEDTLEKVYLSTTDITDRKQAEEKLKESEEKFRNIFQQSPLAIQLYNPDGILLDVNPKTLELFGLEDIKYVSGFNLWNDPQLSEKDAVSLKKGQPVFISTSYDFDTFGDSIVFPTTRKGLIYLDMFVMPMKSMDSIIGYLVQIVEVTDKKLAENEIKKHRDHLKELVNDRTKELQSINKELEAFAYSVSHDLRAPLRAIDGFTRILMEDYVEKLDDEGKRLGDVIQTNAQKMGKLIDDLLAFSRLGRASMQFSRIDMKNMANAIYHEATNSSERKRIKFSVTDLPDAYGDTNMYRLVWMNLISNAIKFSSKREKAVILITSVQDDEKTTYRISDNGAGFDMKYVNKIFDVFQRLHREEEYPGTGVGLSLVQRIIHRHKGKIWAESEVDKGATFYFSLPKKEINETN